ncbi:MULTISPECIES: fimbrial protein [Stenotrophomonas]|uniref:Type 1 fimbrial protein n=1 Tax=Stenotrophomonas maltophilia TaxID=40324 RepID=A0A431UEE7_STEMA|nr:fimbrial protein [Stenotrophomonas maltophilia]RTQ87500.1 type 1 fimbrial protein [Stenotrophomonas maltophilia]
MNKTTLFAVLMLAAAPMAANAADGTITFTGKVTDKTCTIATTGGKDFEVKLPTVSKSNLDATGAVAGRTPFSINLTQCAPGKVATYFEPGTTVDFSSGRLNIGGGANAATNVQVQLLGSNSQFLPIKAAGSGQAQENSQWADVGSDGSANLGYYAEYYATDAATAGDVNTSVKYTIVYN